MLELGIVGKPNTGKTTLFNALTACNAQIAPYPFTTINPNIGITYVRFPCPCREFNIKCNPQNSRCIEGTRFVPIRVIDVAGLIEGAHAGKGLGNRFLDSLRLASVLIHVVDAAGSTDSEGKPCKPGEHDPLEDLEFLEREIDLWLEQIVGREWSKIKRVAKNQAEIIKELTSRLSGLGIRKNQVEEALNKAGMDLKSFCRTLRKITKPIVVAANKIDIQAAEENIKRLEKSERIVMPICAEAELILRRASEKGLVSYIPGSSNFSVLRENELNPQQKNALERVRKILKKWGSTGVQELIDKAIKEVLRLIVVYPVDDENKLTDKKGNVLPDAFLVPEGTTAKEFAYEIHTELGESFLYAIDARTKMRLGEDYKLKSGDIIKIVAAKRRVV